MSTAIYDLGTGGAALQTEIQARIGATTNPAAGTVNFQLKDIEQNTQDSATLLLDIANKIEPALTSFTSTTASITATASAGNIVAAGAGATAKELWLYNSGANTVFVKFGAIASTTDFNFPLPAGMLVILRQIAASVSVSGVCATTLTSSVVATKVV